MIMAVAALLKEKRNRRQGHRRSHHHICRCGTFQQAREAIHAAANA